MNLVQDLAAALVVLSIDPSEQSQLSIGDGVIYAGDDSLTSASQNQLKKLGWYYDEELNSFVFQVPTE